MLELGEQRATSFSVAVSRKNCAVEKLTLCLDRWQLSDVRDAQQIVEAWREDYNLHRPHSALGYLSPAAYAQSLSTLTPTDT